MPVLRRVSRSGCPRPRRGPAGAVAEPLEVPVDHRAHGEQQVAQRLGELARELGRHAPRARRAARAARCRSGAPRAWRSRCSSRSAGGPAGRRRPPRPGVRLARQPRPRASSGACDRAQPWLEPRQSARSAPRRRASPRRLEPASARRQMTVRLWPSTRTTSSSPIFLSYTSPLRRTARRAAARAAVSTRAPAQPVVQQRGGIAAARTAVGQAVEHRRADHLGLEVRAHSTGTGAKPSRDELELALLDGSRQAPK